VYDFTYSIDRGAQHVHHTLADEPAQANLLLHLLITETMQTVNDWKDGTQSHCHEHDGSERSPFWCTELWLKHDY
jgi:hypothetical protein